MSADTIERRLTTILAADAVGYSRLMGVDETGTLGALKAIQKKIIQPLCDLYGGRIIKLMGDGMLMEFASVVDAVTFAVEMQKALETENADTAEDQRITFRIGINIGDIIVDGDDIHGDGVNVAARLEPLAPPGGICISRAVRDQIRDKLDFGLDDLGDVEVKNIARPVRVFRIIANGEQVVSRRERLPVSRWIAAAAFTALVILGGVAWWQFVMPRNDATISGLSPPPALDKPSIAVLPFENRSDAKGQDYFADGLTDDLITDLSKVSGLFVISRNSVFTFRGRAVRVREVARELGVRYVLEGSVRRGGDRVRVNAQLVEGNTGHQVWAERYDRELTDLFAVQDELVSRIVSALAVQLTRSEELKLAPRAAPKFEAYDLYLQAREGFFSREQSRMRESLALFSRAWSIDPDFARAYSGYAQLAADIWRLSSLRYAIGGATARKSAEVAARKALALDPTLADAHSVLALMSMVDGDHKDSMKLARRAVELDPNSSDAHTSMAIVLGYAGRPAEALEEMKTAIRLNPKPPPYDLTYYGWTLFLNGRFADAIAVLKPVAGSRIRSMGDAPSEVLAMAYAMDGQIAEAILQVQALHRDEPFLNLAYYRLVYGHHARQEDLELRLEALRRAGMPEWPYGTEPGKSIRVTGAALGSLISARTWAGRDVGRDSSFVKEFTEQGSVSYAALNTLLNGTAFVRGDELCERYEGFILGKDLCGPVFENPQGTDREMNRYTYVNPTTVVEFSLEN